MDLSCDKTAEPEEIQSLVIEDGYYEELEDYESNLNRVAIELTYYVTKEECQVGGYAIKFDTLNHGVVDWYLMQKLQPEKRYEIEDTLRVIITLTTNPVVYMQGHRIGSSESIETLKAELALKQKR